MTTRMGYENFLSSEDTILKINTISRASMQENELQKELELFPLKRPGHEYPRRRDAEGEKGH